MLLKPKTLVCPLIVASRVRGLTLLSPQLELLSVKEGVKEQ